MYFLHGSSLLYSDSCQHIYGRHFFLCRPFGVIPWLSIVFMQARNSLTIFFFFFPSAMGKSRSVTVTIAYLLRKYPHHTVKSALELIRESRPIAEPNDGFMAQLQLYKEMKCPRDIEAHPKYQRWLYDQEVGLALAAGMAPERVRFRDEEEQVESTGEKEIELRCRKCRYVSHSVPV
jgi:hypothetical protein